MDNTSIAIEGMIIIMVIVGWSDKNAMEGIVGIVTSMIIHLITIEMTAHNMTEVNTTIGVIMMIVDRLNVVCRTLKKDRMIIAVLKILNNFNIIIEIGKNQRDCYGHDHLISHGENLP